MSTKITDLRGSMVRPIHRGSVLLSKQEELCSTSHFTSHFSRRKNTSTLRVTLKSYRSKLYESLLFEREEHFHSTSHYSSREELPALRVITLQAGQPLLYESILSIGNTPALRVIHRGSVLLSKQKALCSTSYYSSSRNISALRVITLHWEYPCSTSYGNER